MYREAAPRERPVERLVLRSKRLWGFIAIMFLGIVLITAIAYGSVNIDCVRPIAGEPARCTGRMFFGEELRPFPLERGSIRSGRTMPDTKNRRFATLITPGGTFTGSGIDADFADRAAGEADRFYEDTSQLEWHAGQTTWVFAAVSDALFLFFILLVLIGRRKKTLDLDPNLRLVAIDGNAWPLDDVEQVVVDSVSDDHRLNFLINGELVPICTGNEASIENAAKRIRAVQKEAR